MSEGETLPPSEDCGDLDIDFKYEILPDDFLQYDLSFKIIVIGDSGVGKSCLTTRATTNLFEDTYSATVGFEFLSFNVKIDEKVIKLQIWDTCGQELYRSLITNFYRNSSLAIIVYEIENNNYNNIVLELFERKEEKDGKLINYYKNVNIIPYKFLNIDIGKYKLNDVLQKIVMCCKVVFGELI